MSATLWAFGAVAFVSLLSLIGAAGLSFGALRRHTVLMGLVALAAGTLIGDAFLHLLPEATHGGFDSSLGMWVIGGFLVMFGVEIVLRRGHSHTEHIDADAHGHDHSPGHIETIEPFGWINLVGDALHNFLDGVIIAAAFLIDTAAGVATTIAVALHEIPQELGDFAVLVRSGFPVKKALLVNFGSALFAFVGALFVLAWRPDIDALQSIALPLIAGAFVYIAAADLIPELHHHTKGRDLFVIVVALLLGIALMYGLLGLEGALPGSADHGHDH